ncbi:MAG: hypothetical protein R8M45_04445 [Ghiorsea sp.]
MMHKETIVLEAAQDALSDTGHKAVEQVADRTKKYLCKVNPSIDTAHLSRRFQNRSKY